MCRFISILTVVLYLAAGDAGEPACPADHVWRGEFERALNAASDAPPADQAVYLTMAGYNAEASSMLADHRDPFSAGFVAFKAKQYEEALDALDAPVDNAYLEVYRRFIRGAALVEMHSYREAAAELDTLFALTEAHPDLADHPGTGRAANIYADLLARCPPDSMRDVAEPPNKDALTGRSRFLLARMYSVAGNWEWAERWFFSGLEAPCDTGTMAPFGETVSRLRDRFHLYGREQLLAIAEYALNEAKSTTAAHIVEHLSAAYRDDYDVRLLQARYQAGIGNVERAVSLSMRLFESSAPVDLKKDALLLAASLEYRLGRYSRASENYRLFGLYYPTDNRSVQALELAARIEVARGGYSRALSIYRELRHRGLHSRLARQAALSEAVLRFHRGSDREAHRILEGLLPKADPEAVPAVLYWLFRTAGKGGADAGWNDRLQREYPHSFYAAVAAGDGGCIRVRPNGPPREDAGRALLEMERQERAIFETVRTDLPPSDPMLLHPAYHAYQYFRSHGLLGEASDCAARLVVRFGRDRDRMAVLYRDARSHGMIKLALTIANTSALFPAGSGLPDALRYPVCFTGTISENADRRSTPAALVLAVIREESRFDPVAVSRAGAVGLMQLMPPTGEWLATKIGAGDHSGENLLDPVFNIKAGTWYLRYLLDRYDGSIVAALAAYNAGHSRLDAWIDRFDPVRCPMIAIEMIGIRETREYVKRVLDSMAAYRSLYADGGGDES